MNQSEALDNAYEQGKVVATARAISAAVLAKEFNQDPLQQLKALTDRKIWLAAEAAHDKTTQEIAAMKSQKKNQENKKL